MAEISLSDCTVRTQNVGEWQEVVVITPSTADSDDYIDMKTLIPSGMNYVNPGSAQAYDITSAGPCLVSGTAGKVVIDGAGGTTNHQYVISFKVV